MYKHTLKGSAPNSANGSAVHRLQSIGEKLASRANQSRQAGCVLLCLLLVSCASHSNQAHKSSSAIIYTSKMIRTMDANNSTSTAVVVDKGIIIAVGTVQTLRNKYPEALLDKTFAHHTLVPGLIDPHMHVLLGSIMYAMPFVTPWPMAMPNGYSTGYPDRSNLIKRLQAVTQSAPPNQQPVFAYGYHNLVQGPLTRHDLDAVTSTRPLIVWHYSGHDFYLNTLALELAGITAQMHNVVEGIELDENGELTGRIYETAAWLLFDKIGPYLFAPENIKKGIDRYFSIIQNAGITTTAEMAYGAFNRALENQVIQSNWSLEKSRFRLFLVPEFRAFNKEFGTEGPQTVLQMSQANSTPAPVLPNVKFFTDAAFYSQTMRLAKPGYLSGQSKGTSGLWVLPPDDIAKTIQPYWDKGLNVHIHSNGDAAQTATLAALAELRQSNPSPNFVIEHGGLFSPAHIEQAAELDAIVSAASHYAFYMAKHYQKPLEGKAAWITPLGDLANSGVTVTVHSDAPLAPPQPLKAAQISMTRETQDGSVFHQEQALNRLQALRVITIDAAKALGLDQHIGSIEPGKKADFTVLKNDPLATSPEAWADIPIWGIVLGGERHALPE